MSGWLIVRAFSSWGGALGWDRGAPLPRRRGKPGNGSEYLRSFQGQRPDAIPAWAIGPSIVSIIIARANGPIYRVAEPWGFVFFTPDAGEGGLDFFLEAGDQLTVGSDKRLLGFDLGDDGLLGFEWWERDFNTKERARNNLSK